MKKLLLLSVILLAACNKQDEPSVEPTQATIIPYVKKHHAKSDRKSVSSTYSSCN